MAKVSVTVPAYNSEATIKRCLSSILSQTMEDIEVTVVNDGSQDGTALAAKRMNDSRIRVITTENQGQGFARNAGIDAAKGEYLAFVDADDTIECDMLELMYNAAKENGSQLVQCNLYDIFQDGSRRVQLDAEDKTVAITDRGRYMDEYFTPCRHSYEVCNKLIKRSALRGLRFRDTRKYFSEDLMFNIGLISRVNRVTFLSKPLYNYYQSETSHMHSGQKRLEGICDLFRDAAREADDDIRDALSYTAAMVIIYTAGLCGGNESRAILCGGELEGYIKSALARRCRSSHKLLLKAMLYAPPWLKAYIADRYGGRWKR